MAVFDLSHIKEVEKATKLQNKSLFFKSALLILTVSTKASHSTNLFCSFSHYQAQNHTQPTISLDSLRRRANARNVSFRIFLRWPTVYIINPVDRTKLSWNKLKLARTRVAIHLICFTWKQWFKGNENTVRLFVFKHCSLGARRRTELYIYAIFPAQRLLFARSLVEN